METKENNKYKTWRVSPDSESSWPTDREANSGKKFTIPKIRRTTEKVYLSSCHTNTREYGFIHSTLKQCRLDTSCDLELTWQFGDTKLVRNEYLERHFAAKRSEMRENGRRGRELEEHFCFLALPRSDVVEIYQNGLSTRASTLKTLGNPLLGIYMFRHVDIALNYAHSRSTTVDNIMIFKVLFGKVKKIQPSIDKNKVSLDPFPNFDCHISRNMPSLKDTIELQAYNSLVYFYEYDFVSRPVVRPRQCLPYAIVTVKFIGQKAGNGQLMTSLRFPSTGFPKRFERACSLNNCTIAKRIGKGKDATVIFEHFRKPVDPFDQENCLCKVPNSEYPYNLDTSSSYGNMQNGNNSLLRDYSRQTDNPSEVIDASQVHTYNSGLSFMSTANTASDNGDLLNVTYLEKILNSIFVSEPSQNSASSSTVITSKLIKDPRLMKREQSMRKQSNSADLSDGLPLDKIVGHGNSEIKLTCMPTSSISIPESIPADHAVTNCSDVSCFRFSSESSHCQTHNMGSKDYDCTASSKVAITEQYKEQSSFFFPRYLPNAFSGVGKQTYNEEEAQRAQKRSSFQVLTEQSNGPQNSFESEKNTYKDSQSHISKASWPSDLSAVFKFGYQMSTVFPIQKKGNIDEYVQNTGMMRTFISPEDSSKHVINQTWWKETANSFTNGTKSIPIANCFALHQEHKEGENINSLRENCEKIPDIPKLQMPKSPISTTKDKNEVDHAALELECNLTPNTGCLSQKHPQYSLEHTDNIHTNFAIAQGLIELKAVQNNEDLINIMTDAFQEAKGIPLAREQLVDRVISSDAIDISLDRSSCNIIGEYISIQREDENEAVSLYNIQKDCKGTSHIKDNVQDYSLPYDAELSSELNLKIILKEQRNDENPTEAKEKDGASSSQEYNTNTINESEKQDFYANIVELSNTKVEILNSEECTAFNSTWRKKDRPAKAASSESEDNMTAIKQKHPPNDGRSVEHLSTFPETEESSVCVASDATEEVVSTTVLTASTNHGDHPKHHLKEPEISGLGLVKQGISDCEIDTDKLQDFYHLINEKSIHQTSGLGSEIEVELEEHNDAPLFQQNIDNNGNDLCDEFETLKSRIDWEGLFGKSYEETEASSFPRRESTDPHHSTECNCVSFSSQKDKREHQNPIFLPDLQVTITNLISLKISPTDDSLEWKDNFYKHVTESTEPELNEKRKALGFGIYYQPFEENSGFSCENKFGNSVQESGHVSKSGISNSSNSNHNTHMNHTPGKPTSDSLSTEQSNVTVISDKSKCSTKSKPDFNDTRNKKDMGSRSSKGNQQATSRGQNISHKDLRQHETHEKRRKSTNRDSSKRFSSLSQGRIKTFSQSERHIRNVLNILNNEASLCKSKHLSRKLGKAVLHLKKAHKRVHTSLQLISKVGKKRKGPLPKAYAVICNNFWESCDLQGDSLMSERRYSDRHFLSKRRYDKQGEKRLRFDNDESLASVSKHRTYRTNRERIAECLSSEIMSGHVASSLTTFHVREFCDEEQLHESQLSQSISQLGYTNSVGRTASSSELLNFSETSEYTLYPDETLAEKEYQTNTQLSKSESHTTCNTKNITKENNSEDKTVVCESNSVSLSFLKDNISHSQDKSYDITFKANTNKLVSVLDSNKPFLNVDICEQGNLVSDGSRNGETVFPVEKCTVLTEITPNIPTGKTANRRNTIPPLSPIIVTADEEESSVGGNGLLHVKENEVNITKHSKLDLTSVTEESQSYKKNVKKLSFNDSSLLLKENVKGPSKAYMAKYKEEEKMRKIEQEVYQKMVTEGSAGYKHQNKILKEDSFHLHKKIIKNNLTDSCVGIKNSTLEKTALKNISSELSKRQKTGQIKQLSNDCHSDCPSKSATAGTSDRLIVHENSEVTVSQMKPLSHMEELHEYTSRVRELSQILQRADEAASLQVLEEEIKVCQNILPVFVEAFERKQECSLNQILISRKLLVEQNLWSNCKLQLKLCAIDTWVELQMAMETIQFIENKKRFLEGEPTFRSLLWYDESLYSELLLRPRGYQLQSSFYPAFQRRLKYNAFCELQKYYQIIETRKKKNSYYTFLKYKRQRKECEAVMKHHADCSEFCLSVPFTCGVNFGDSLGDLEALRKSVLKLISIHGGSPKVSSYPGKEDHLWIILEMVSSKISFIKSNEEISIKICLYGLEHIYFDAAKSLVWKEKSHSFPRRHSEMNRELEEINECAFSEWKKIYDNLSEDLNNESAPTIGLEEGDMIASRQSALVSVPNCKLNTAWLSYPDICCISEILDQAKSADLEKLQDLTLRCTVHLEILKKYFQMLQEDNIDNIFITEENVLDMLNRNHGAVILKPEAIEIYIETVMLSETIHFLKNSIAEKLHNQRFRGMLWFDWSLLPELVGCQEEMASFSLDNNQTDCLWKVIENAISHLKEELEVVCDYSEAVNCSYALHLFSRELKELSGIKRLLNTSEYSVSTYIDVSPHIASVNYGNTVTELEHNYNQLFILLKNIMSVPQKDFGKMVHIIKVLKTIEHMKMINAKDTKLSTRILFFQMLRNRRNTLQLNRKERVGSPSREPEEDSCEPSVSVQTPSAAEYTIRNISSSSKKRPVTVDKHEISQGKGNTGAVSNLKKQKVTMKDIRSGQKTVSENPRTIESHPQDDSLKRDSASPETVKRQSSTPGSLSPSENVQDTCTPKSESKIELTDSSSDVSECLAEQHKNLNGITKRNVNFSAAETNDNEDRLLVTCDQNDIDATFSPDSTPAQKLHENPTDHTQICPSDIGAGNDSPIVPNASLPTSHPLRAIHSHLEMSDTVFEHEDSEILDLSIKDCTYTSSPEPVCIQNKIPVLQVYETQPIKSESPEKYVKDAPNPTITPFGSHENSAVGVNQTAQHTLSELSSGKYPEVPTQEVVTPWNAPQPTCTAVYNSSEYSFGTPDPYYAWRFYQYSSSSTAVTHTYQEMTTYETPPPPMMTAVASAVQNTHFNHSYSEHFSYFAMQPQANAFIPGNGYSPSPMPVSYNYQQPAYSQFASHQLAPQAVCPYPPNPGVLPQVPWTYAPWQQDPFPPRHYE